MVDVTGKDATKRTAVAAGTFHTTADVVALIASGGLPKGDALATARVAGILAAKRTSDLIPLCHPLALTGVDVDFEIGDESIGITATVRTTDRTGVEMEALTAVSVAALTLYDMIKAVDHARAVRDHHGRRSGDALLVEPVDADRAAAVLVDACRGPRGGDHHTSRSRQHRVHSPVLPPSLRSTRMSSMRAAGSTALIMS